MTDKKRKRKLNKIEKKVKTYSMAIKLLKNKRQKLIDKKYNIQIDYTAEDILNTNAALDYIAGELGKGEIPKNEKINPTNMSRIFLYFNDEKFERIQNIIHVESQGTRYLYCLKEEEYAEKWKNIILKTPSIYCLLINKTVEQGEKEEMQINFTIDGITCFK